MTITDIDQCIHLMISTNIGVTSIIVKEDKGVSFMGGHVAPLHSFELDALEDVPQKVCELVNERRDELNLTPENMKAKTALVRWGKVRYLDDSNVRIRCCIGVDLLNGGAV